MNIEKIAVVIPFQMNGFYNYTMKTRRTRLLSYHSK